MPLISPINHPTKNHTCKAKHTMGWRCFILFCIGLLFQTSPLFAAVSAEKVKAAYIYQLTQFVTWPDTPALTNTDFTICIFGKDSISNELAPLNKHQQGGRLINIRHPKKIQDIKGCHILYIAKSKQHQLHTLFKHAHNKPILTVSSIPNFTANGGSIGFIIVDNKVRLEINRAPARRAGIQLGAKLLEVANIVRDDASKEAQP